MYYLNVPRGSASVREDRFDEGDDEFGARPETGARSSTTSVAVPIDLSAHDALAAVIGLGAGSLWLLRRGRD